MLNKGLHGSDQSKTSCRDPWRKSAANPIVRSVMMLARSPQDLAVSLTPALHQAAREAGTLALGFFRPGAKTSARLWTKERGSPVTEADVAVDGFLKSRLAQILPDAGWLSEETADNPDRLANDLVWIVDPIDGTRAFVAGHRDWSIAIALLVAGQPVLGVVHAPAHGRFYEASAGAGARVNGARMSVSARDRIEGARTAGPKPLVDAFERRAGGPLTRLDKIPSLALRLVRVAEGTVDVGLVSSDSRDWDLAAADLILQEAGGRVTDLAGRPLRYNQADPVHGELAAAALRLHPRVIEAMTAS
jgi:myo-inositol-1(or 4)-monophosphatase